MDHFCNKEEAPRCHVQGNLTSRIPISDNEDVELEHAGKTGKLALPNSGVNSHVRGGSSHSGTKAQRGKQSGRQEHVQGRRMCLGRWMFAVRKGAGLDERGQLQ